MDQTVPKRTRRIKTWWEPTFNPAIADSMTFGDWALPDNAAVLRYFTNDTGEGTSQNYKSKSKYTGSRFTNCDFFCKPSTPMSGINFRNCEFILCDFGTSTWKNAKFTSCTFDRCSFSQSTWIETEFRHCTWKNIGISGNETILEKVFISNPQKFIDAAYTNVDPHVLKQNNVSPDFQTTRLEETKSTVARNIFTSHKIVGDDDTFYKAFATSSQQYIKSLRSSALYDIKTKSGKERRVAIYRWISSILEGFLNRQFGIITKWGSRSVRPLTLLLLTFFIFSVIYRVFFLKDIVSSMQMAFDITSIAGFTRSVSEKTGIYLYIVSCINLALSIIFYSAFFSVAISKISRTR